jgi:hypothetical protein
MEINVIMMILNLVLLLLLAHSPQFSRRLNKVEETILITTTAFGGIQTTFLKMELLSPCNKMS